MRRHALPVLMLLFGAISACSLEYNLHDRYTFDLVDAGLDAGPDSGSGDAGPGEAPPVPLLRFPWNGYQTGSAHTASLPVPRNAMRPRFLWEPSAGAARYEVALSRDCASAEPGSCDFGSALVFETPETDWRPAAPLPIATTPPVGSRYAWRVRACASDPSICSDWSPTRYLDVGRMGSDFNGDGYADLAVGAPNERDGIGIVHLFYGSEEGIAVTPSATVNIPAPFTWGSFGSDCATGDWDADGFGDLAIGMFGQEMVFIYYGSPSGIDEPHDLSLEDPSTTFASYFGESVASVGDVNSDGFQDLVVGASRTNGFNSMEGAAYVYFGSTRGIDETPSTSLENPDHNINDNFGISISGDGDINGDGHSDFMIGATGRDPGGSAFLYLGGSDIGESPSIAIPNPTFQPRGGFGISISMGDIDGDGLSDFVVSADTQDGMNPREGISYLFFGSRGRPEEIPVEFSSPSHIESGYFGSAVSLRGDVDSDGIVDLVIGADRYDASVSNEGAAYVYYGRSDRDYSGPSVSLFNPDHRANSYFGNSLSSGFDFDGNGYLDLLVGAPFQTSTSTTGGAVYRFIGSGRGVSESTRIEIPNPTMGEASAFGSSIVHVSQK